MSWDQASGAGEGGVGSLCHSWFPLASGFADLLWSLESLHSADCSHPVYCLELRIEGWQGPLKEHPEIARMLEIQPWLQQSGTAARLLVPRSLGLAVKERIKECYLVMIHWMLTPASMCGLYLGFSILRRSSFPLQFTWIIHFDWRRGARVLLEV